MNIAQVTFAQERARKWEEQKRRELAMLARSGSRVHGGGFAPHWGAAGDRPNGEMQRQMGGLSLRYGQTPTDANLRDYIRMQGGNPHLREMAAMQQPGKRTAPKTADAAATENDGLLDALTADFQNKQNRANYENRNRFNAVVQGQQALRGRVMGDLNQQGEYEAEKARQGSKDSLAEQLAYLERHGLANSTIMPAFMGKSKKDLNLELSRQREDRQTRMADADMRLSQNLFDTVEHKTDQGPDPREFALLAQQIARADALRQPPQQQATQQPMRRAPIQSQGGGGGGVPAWMAQNMAGQIAGGFNGVEQAQGMLSGGGGVGIPLPIIRPQQQTFTYTPREPMQLTPEQEVEQRMRVERRRRSRTRAHGFMTPNQTMLV